MSPRNGAATRTRILDSAQMLISNNGFSATSLDMVIAASGITKGAFFYHFKNKADLAESLMERLFTNHRAFVRRAVEDAEKRHADAFMQLIDVIDAFEGEVLAMLQLLNGCPVATFVYEEPAPDSPVMRHARDFFMEGQVQVAKKIREAARQHGVQVDDMALADMLVVVYEGIAVLVRVTGDQSIITRQFTHYRNYLQLVFNQPAAAPAGRASPKPRRRAARSAVRSRAQKIAKR